MAKALPSSLRSQANRAWYAWKRNNWMVDPRCLVAHVRPVTIDRPIFLVGNQGDGLTLISRMLRRHPEVVSLSGNHRYWVGADEIHRAFLGRLPPSLVNGNRRLGRAPHHEVLTPPRSWSYGADDLIGRYRRTAADYDERAARKLRSVLRESLYRHGRPQGGRFTDKSQTFAVKMSFIDALLRDTNPHFVLITRDPYATCYRNAKGGSGDMRRYAETMDLDERFEICLQHWRNTLRCVEEDKDRVCAFTRMRFEDLFVDPRGFLDRLCNFLGLTFDDRMVPAPGDRVPFGNRFTSRWYPLRPDVNDRYLAELPAHFEKEIVERIGDLAATLGYLPPLRRRDPLTWAAPE